jgi:small subunit ribosomal protein SAe
MSQFPNALKPSEEDIAKMLACQVHLGSRNSNTAMETYIYKRRNDGIHIFDLSKTWAKVRSSFFSRSASSNSLL